jgi:hypothetical protein
MRYHSILAEKTAADLYRKIDALDATINDRATTDSEKSSAATLKARLVDKLKSEFPGAERPAPQSSRSGGGQAADDWTAGFARGMDEYDEYQRVKADPTADRSKYRAQIERLKAERRRVAPARGLGDTHATERVKEIDRRVRRIYQDMFPEEWAEIERKRDIASRAAAERAWEKRKTANDEKVTASKKAGLSYKEAGKLHPESLKALATALKHRYAKPTNILYYLMPAHTKKADLKAALAKMSPEDAANVKEMVSAIHTNGYTEDHPGFTPRQKADILSAFAPVFDPAAAPKTGQTWTDFKTQYEPIMAKMKYRHNQWDKGKSLFDIFGQTLNAYARSEAESKIKRNLTKADRATLVSALQGVAPANQTEQARVNKLIALLQ